MLDVLLEAMRGTMVRMVAGRSKGALTLMPALQAIPRLSIIAETAVAMYPVLFRLIHRLLMAIIVKRDMTTRYIVSILTHRLNRILNASAVMRSEVV